MRKRYYLDEKLKERSKQEQAEINRQNEEEWWQSTEKAIHDAVEYIRKQQDIRFAINSGDIALTCEELSILEFNSNYTIAKYDGKEVNLKRGGLENEMVRILGNAASSKVKTVAEEQLIGSMERATGKDCDFKTVRNTRDRLNAKFQSELGIVGAIKMVDNTYRLEERYLHPPRKLPLPTEIKSGLFLNYRGKLKS